LEAEAIATIARSSTSYLTWEKKFEKRAERKALAFSLND
jgi:hypothetical protein